MGVSIRRTCQVLEATQATYHNKSRRRDQAVLAARIKKISQRRVRYGYLLSVLSGVGSADQPPREDVVQTLERVCGEIGHSMRFSIMAYFLWNYK